MAISRCNRVGQLNNGPNNGVVCLASFVLNGVPPIAGQLDDWAVQPVQKLIPRAGRFDAFEAGRGSGSASNGESLGR